ncbi:hypothetical protein FIBSPDRAFT_901390 [Athelia psychrophila]|uniref:Uncharacterized protein n=1 Tax=Athelia psychrophila TaxID=1759441 RepID=A0A165X630_9AGAM|nr:hypothetical protein FIBSPDRAFT_901390 [Fibularhizoctonia sp. CBS 109695]
MSMPPPPLPASKPVKQVKSRTMAASAGAKCKSVPAGAKASTLPVKVAGSSAPTKPKVQPGEGASATAPTKPKKCRVDDAGTAPAKAADKTVKSRPKPVMILDEVVIGDDSGTEDDSQTPEPQGANDNSVTEDNSQVFSPGEEDSETEFSDPQPKKKQKTQKDPQIKGKAKNRKFNADKKQATEVISEGDSSEVEIVAESTKKKKPVLKVRKEAAPKIRKEAVPKISVKKEAAPSTTTVIQMPRKRLKTLGGIENMDAEVEDSEDEDMPAVPPAEQSDEDIELEKDAHPVEDYDEEEYAGTYRNPYDNDVKSYRNRMTMLQ